MSKVTLDASLLDSKEYQKLAKHWGDAAAKQLLEKSLPELKELLASKQIDKRNIKAEVEANEAYQAAKAVVKDFNASTRETLAPIDAAINMIAVVLASK
jgi:hypothetical protein